MKKKLVKIILFIAIPAILFAASARIKDLGTTTTTAAVDDYVALDGTTNGTRKMLASYLYGSGNVSGPGSSVDNRIVTWNSTTGTALRDGTNITATANIVTSAGNLTLVSATSNNIILTPGTGGVVSIPGNATVGNVTVSTGFDLSGATITGTISGANGGTGVANTGKSITLGGNLTTSGAHTTTFTTSANTSVTLPTTGTLATLAGSEVFTNKTLDASATGNVLKQKGYVYLTHPHLADGTNATIGTTATSIAYGHATFSNSVDEASNYVEYYIQVPEDVDTSVALRARLKILLGNTDTGTHRYVLSTVSVADSAVPTSSTLANPINIDFAGDGSGANGDVETSAWTTLTSWAGALTAGQTWRIRLARDGNATEDASTVNSTELGLVIEYGSTQ